MLNLNIFLTFSGTGPALAVVAVVQEQAAAWRRRRRTAADWTCGDPAMRGDGHGVWRGPLGWRAGHGRVEFECVDPMTVNDCTNLKH